jgi:hypothetical protein
MVLAKICRRQVAFKDGFVKGRGILRRTGLQGQNAFYEG